MTARAVRLSLPTSRPRCVLLVDDDALTRRALTRVLEREGWMVESAADGQEAVRCLRNHNRRIDVVLSDIHMPGLNGIGLMDRLGADASDVPVVLITGEPSPETAIEAIRGGATGYLSKPVKVEELLAQLSRACQRHDATRLGRRVNEADATGHRELEDLRRRFDAALEGLSVRAAPIVRWTSRSVHGWQVEAISSIPGLRTARELRRAAELLNRMDDLGRRARRACVASWRSHSEGCAAPLFIHIHPFELRDPELIASSASLGANAHDVVLGMSYRSNAARLDDVVPALDRLREGGFRILVGDLGEGYASLSTVAHLEPDFLELDKALTAAVQHSSIKTRLVHSLVDLCGELDTGLIATSVETNAELGALVDLGCDLFQGNLFAPPSASFPRPIFPTQPGSFSAFGGAS